MTHSSKITCKTKIQSIDWVVLSAAVLALGVMISAAIFGENNGAYTQSVSSSASLSLSSSIK